MSILTLKYCLIASFLHFIVHCDYISILINSSTTTYLLVYNSLVFHLCMHHNLFKKSFTIDSICSYFKKSEVALAGWLCWLECRPVHQNIVGLMLGQGTHPGCSLVRATREAACQCFSLSQINKYILR